MQSSFIPSSIWDRSTTPELSRALWDGLGAVPEKFRVAVLTKFEAESKPDSAIEYLSGAVESLSGSALALSASDAEICGYAADRAREVRELLMSQAGAMIASDMSQILAGYCQEHGARAPEKVLLAGLVARMTDVAWWRRQLRRGIARQVEAHAIGLGFVHRRAGLYASDEAVSRCAEQQERNRKILESTMAENEEGYISSLADLAAVGVSNPRIRRGELMTRIAGFEAFAKAAGHVGMFYTATAPGRMHPRLSSSGQENKRFDGTTPKECAGYLSKTWAKARAWLHRRNIHIYGFRVAEPHHDGTPHWHMLFFMISEAVESVTACLRKYFCESDAHELNSAAAEGARFQSVKIDWNRGSAAGYISKYIAKNIDGLRNDLGAVGDDFEADEPTAADKTAPRVLAWASTWGIRQFQQIGGPGVTVWRELRRLRDMQQGDLFDTWSAADTGNWEEFTRRQGGVECRRDDRPVRLWKEAEEGKTTKYGEEAGPEIKGVRLGEEVTITRLHTWEIRRGKNGSAEKTMHKMLSSVVADVGACAVPEVRRGWGLTLGPKAPWSPVNNCTQAKKDADGHALGEFENQMAQDISDTEMQKIKTAEVSAVLAGIAAKRKRGAFGQFPILKHPKPAGETPTQSLRM